MAALDDVRVFAAVVEERSFTGAANALGLPRATVSRRVAALESHMGARLLHRTTRRVSLTEIGAAYYQRCRAGLDLLGEGEALVRASQQEPRGLLRLTAIADLADLHIAPLLNDFLTQYPKVQLEVVLTDRVVDLVGERFDLAIRAGSLSDSSLVARRLGQGSLSMYASPSYLERRGVPRAITDLADHDCLLVGPQLRSGKWHLQADGDTRAVDVTGPLRCNTFSFALAAVAAGAGIAFVPRTVACAMSRSGKVVPVLPEYTSPDSRLSIVYPSGRHLSAAARALRDFLVERLPATLELVPRAAIRVVGAAIVDGERCLVAQRGPGMAEAGAWEFPGGKLEPGEVAEEALSRELREELGVDVRVGAELGAHIHQAPDRDIDLRVFRATIVDGKPEAREHAALRWCEADDLEGLQWCPADVPIVPAVARALGSTP